MLPTATRTRVFRESTTGKRNGRSVEISRLIGRSIRSAIDLTCFGERTIFIDCDVLQADGGTRTACITAAGLALSKASELWIKKGIASKSVLIEPVTALSAGVVNGDLLVDLDHDEDTCADADLNFVFTKSGKIIEMQGTAEKEFLSWQQCVDLKEMTENALTSFFDLY